MVRHCGRHSASGNTPPPFPGMENVEVVARMEPAREVGGDLYDFFPVDGEHLGGVVADVSGKGAAAGLCRMQARAFLRSSAGGEISPASAVKRVNRLICCDNPASNFVTISARVQGRGGAV